MPKLSKQERDDAIAAAIAEHTPMIECGQCGGEGLTSDCFEEFACVYPWNGCDYCTQICDICGGAGCWPDPDYHDEVVNA